MRAAQRARAQARHRAAERAGYDRRRLPRRVVGDPVEHGPRAVHGASAATASRSSCSRRVARVALGRACGARARRARGAGGFGHTGAARMSESASEPAPRAAGARVPPTPAPAPDSPRRSNLQRAPDHGGDPDPAGVWLIALGGLVAGLAIVVITAARASRVLPADRGEGRACRCAAVGLVAGAGAAARRVHRQRVPRDAADDGGAARP